MGVSKPVAGLPRQEKTGRLRADYDGFAPLVFFAADILQSVFRFADFLCCFVVQSTHLNLCFIQENLWLEKQSFVVA